MTRISIPEFLILTLLSLILFAVPALATPQKSDAKARKTQPAKPVMTGDEIVEARELLGHLGYWVVLEKREPDDSLYHALVAFQKIERRAITGKLTKDELQALRNATRPEPLEWGYNHIEVDLVRQVLFVVDCCGAILRILPISSGSGELFTEGGWTRRAITPIGRFKITRQIKGWRKSPLGLLYYPNYFTNGIAIHGNPAVPTFPASHGCVRIPMFAAKEFSDMATVGMPVVVHDGKVPPALEKPLAKLEH
ncbi:MAG TPA: L,D-transpeptidase family protein [Blastocatellia bacterium]|nr:L,D-transpeptidase family protein [Blastocatellia bacterium]